ncbi:hypothetical protein LCGC14_1450970 [marine sediment metagenome]|uniref:Uncharacterized protein n=1 Tax=marine sediment metagenome TaxID=412755 RepID=A0A0F9K472_9ZZZZ
MKYFGYQNTTTNCLLGINEGGAWIQVSYLKYLFLKLSGCVVKKEKE